MIATASTSGEAEARRFGRFEIEETIGRGGMGEVLLAYDRTLDRHVALKLLREGRRLDARTKARLRREARLLSRLDHPNVCRIHDLVEEGDREAIVLEYVEGRTLAEALGDDLSTAEKLQIVEMIAAVLSAAHREGIVHRDLKPGNVILRPDGAVKVLDFGLARLHALDVEPTEATGFELRPRPLARDGSETPPDSTLEATVTMVGSGGERTEIGRVTGTPAYMSPEQARGEPLTPASDMYSFGLLLQALLADVPPHPPAISSQEAIERGRRGERQPAKGARADLRQLIDALLVQEPRDRPSADQTLERLRRIRARNARWARRTAAAAALAFLLFLGAKYVLDLNRERAAAARAQGRAESTVEFLTSMFGDVTVEGKPIDQVTVRDLLEGAIDSLPERLPPDPVTRAQIAASLTSALFDLGLYTQMDRLLESEPVVSAYPAADPESRDRLRRGRIVSAMLLRKRTDETEALIREGLAASSPGSADNIWYRRELIRLLRDRGELAEAEALARVNLRAARERSEDDPSGVVTALQMLGRLLHSRQELAEAEALYSEALELTLSEIGEDHGFASTLRMNLGELALGAGRVEEAAGLYRAAYQNEVKRFGSDHIAVTGPGINLASTLQRLERYEEAAPIAERVLAIRERTLGPDHELTASALETFAWGRHHLGATEEAVTMLDRALEIRRASDPNGSGLATPLRLLGQIARDRGQLASAVEHYTEIIEIVAPERATSNDAIRRDAAALRDLLVQTGQDAEARSVAERFDLDRGPESDRAP